MAIQLLPPQLANQIAAGEVVERPASVVKELVENSLDAGATRIDIEIDKGGSKLIRIRDNGHGIEKAELVLALSRHATSKVFSLDDLEAILSFGFRGEALASISSVSRLTLTSKTAEQSEAWQAYAEGSQMDVKITPAAHPQGTTIEVVDLFFNTPARRRFLKSDKTEFTHIDEWLKRIAISRTDVHFVLTHNGKIVRQYRPANTELQYQQRLGQICGQNFAQSALAVSCEHDGLSLSGYLQSPRSSVLSDAAYFYVNGRLVRDRLVNHAVRQAFAEHNTELQPGYVLMLTLDPHQVDVNVHPAKHEVRFHQSRYVHDFILQALQSALGQMVFDADEQLDDISRPAQDELLTPIHQEIQFSEIESEINQPSSDRSIEHERIAEYVPSKAANSSSQFGTMYVPGKSSFNRPIASQPLSSRSSTISHTAVSSYSELLQTQKLDHANIAESNMPLMPPLLAGKYWVITGEDTLNLLPIVRVHFEVRKQEVLSKLSTGLIGQPLLMPVSIKADVDWQNTLELREGVIRQLGLELTIRYGQLIIKKVPPYLRESKLAEVIPELLQWMLLEQPSEKALAAWIAKKSELLFEPSQTIWQKYCLLDETSKTLINADVIILPWHKWVEDQHLD